MLGVRWGEGSSSFFMSVAERLISEEVLLSRETLEVLLNLCLYPEEPVQSAAVGSLWLSVGYELVTAALC